MSEKELIGAAGASLDSLAGVDEEEGEAGVGVEVEAERGVEVVANRRPAKGRAARIVLGRP